MGLLPSKEAKVSGRIMFEGRDLFALSEAEMRTIRGARIGMVFQEPMTALNPLRRIGWQVAEMLTLHTAMTRRELNSKTLSLIESVGIGEPERIANSYPHQLSGGMAQRAALARALVNDPQLLILDEPLGKLDSLTRLTMQSELVSLWQRKGFTALLVTHDVEEALIMASRVIVLSDRPARIKAEVVNDLPYPRHRGDPRLAELRHEVLSLLGLDATW